MNNTPQTDALEKTPMFATRPKDPICGEALLHARKMERERNEAKSEIEMLNIRYAAAEMCHANNMDEVTKQRDVLAEKVRWMEEQEALYTIIE